MKCTILHESRGRMRVHVNAVRMTLHRADVLEAYLNHSEVIEHAKVYERTGDVLIKYKGSRAGAVTVLSHYKFDNPELDSLVTSADSRKINQEYQERFVNLVVFRAFRKLFRLLRCGPLSRCSKQLNLSAVVWSPVASQAGSGSAGCTFYRCIVAAR